MAFEDTIVAAILAFGAIAFIFGVAVYIYWSLALMRIAKKIGTEPAWLAWIPIANLYLMSQMAGMHWWPVLLVVGGFIPIIGVLAAPALMVFTIVWLWKIFEKVGKPNWWAVLCLIPIVNLVLIGIAAWGEDTTITKVKKPATSTKKKKKRR